MNIALNVDAKVRADARLALGSVTDVVEVRASDIALQTDSSKPRHSRQPVRHPGNA